MEQIEFSEIQGYDWLSRKLKGSHSQSINHKQLLNLRFWIFWTPRPNNILNDVSNVNVRQSPGYLEILLSSHEAENKWTIGNLTESLTFLIIRQSQDRRVSRSSETHLFPNEIIQFSSWILSKWDVKSTKNEKILIFFFS